MISLSSFILLTVLHETICTVYSTSGVREQGTFYMYRSDRMKLSLVVLLLLACAKMTSHRGGM